MWVQDWIHRNVGISYVNSFSSFCGLNCRVCCTSFHLSLLLSYVSSSAYLFFSKGYQLHRIAKLSTGQVTMGRPKLGWIQAFGWSWAFVCLTSCQGSEVSIIFLQTGWKYVKLRVQKNPNFMGWIQDKGRPQKEYNFPSELAAGQNFWHMSKSKLEIGPNTYMCWARSKFSLTITRGSKLKILHEFGK